MDHKERREDAYNQQSMDEQRFEALEREYERQQSVKQHVCAVCSNTCFFDTAKPTRPGQVYSEAGIRELSISGLCEHCFDEITRPPDEDDDE